MIIDFAKIKNLVMETYDHKNLNDVLTQPTAECMAEDIWKMMNEAVNKTNSRAWCYKVQVIESNGSTIEFSK